MCCLSHDYINRAERTIKANEHSDRHVYIHEKLPEVLVCVCVHSCVCTPRCVCMCVCTPGCVCAIYVYILTSLSLYFSRYENLGYYYMFILLFECKIIFNKLNIFIKFILQIHFMLILVEILF